MKVKVLVLEMTYKQIEIDVENLQQEDFSKEELSKGEILKQKVFSDAKSIETIDLVAQTL